MFGVVLNTTQSVTRILAQNKTISPTKMFVKKLRFFFKNFLKGVLRRNFKHFLEKSI